MKPVSAWAIAHWNKGILPETVCRTRKEAIRCFVEAVGMSEAEWRGNRAATVYKPVKVIVLPAPASLKEERDRLARDAVSQFAKEILHGDAEHREWLTAAADAFNEGRPLPPPNGKGRAEAAEAKLAAATASNEALSVALERAHDLIANTITNDLEWALAVDEEIQAALGSAVRHRPSV